MGIFSKIIKEYGGFEELIESVSKTKLEKHCDRIYQQYCNLFSDATYLLNVEWLLRHFNASKKITISALFYTQTNYLLDHNIKNISFYSIYYSLFNALSSNILMFPQLSLTQVQKVSHAKVFNHISNYLVKHGIYEEETINTLNELKLMREAYSYHLPLGGSFSRDGEKLHFDKLFSKLSNTLIHVIQLTDLYSYLAHYAWEKKVGKALDQYDEFQFEVDQMFFSFIELHDHLGKYCLIDDDDYYRQGYVLRKWPTPFPISWFITEKMCEDLECGWEDEDDTGYEIGDVRHFLAASLKTI